MISEIAKESGFCERYVNEMEASSSISFLSFAFSSRVFGATNEDYLWEFSSRSSWNWRQRVLV